MKILWEVDSEDIQKVRACVKRYQNENFVRTRIAVNVKKPPVQTTRKRFWHDLVMCLVTTQQRSGPNSLVRLFLDSGSLLLDYSYCQSNANLASSAERELAKYRLRRSTVLAMEITANLTVMDEQWDVISGKLKEIRMNASPKTERSVVRYLQEVFKGIGPKQSRNLLQSLGLSRYEIPVDSRITKWLNLFGFPVRLTAIGLSDEEYYSCILDGIQSLCKKARVYPCVLDAAIFISFNKASEDGGTLDA